MERFAPSRGQKVNKGLALEIGRRVGLPCRDRVDVVSAAAALALSETDKRAAVDVAEAPLAEEGATDDNFEL